MTIGSRGRRATRLEIITTYTGPIVPDGKARRRDFYAWPYYDNLTTGSGPNGLNDGDLLAPVLLNVNPKIHGLATLQTLRPILEGGLAKVPQGVGLADATDADINTVAALFAPLGISGRFGVKGTTLAKVLHRKRPHLIPLFVQYVFATYTP